MTTWIALLRGVNVGGVTIRSSDLADVFARLGLDDVRTVLASGNVRFRADADVSARAQLKARIEAALSTRFDYRAWILLVTLDELRAAVDAFPFDDTDVTRHAYVILCLDAATVDSLVAEGTAGDDLAAGTDVVYWSTPKGTTVDSAFGKALARKTYSARTTNRNIRTLRKLLP